MFDNWERLVGWIKKQTSWLDTFCHFDDLHKILHLNFRFPKYAKECEIWEKLRKMHLLHPNDCICYMGEEDCENFVIKTANVTIVIIFESVDLGLRIQVSKKNAQKLCPKLSAALRICCHSKIWIFSLQDLNLLGILKAVKVAMKRELNALKDFNHTIKSAGY